MKSPSLNLININVATTQAGQRKYFAFKGVFVPVGFFFGPMRVAMITWQ